MTKRIQELSLEKILDTKDLANKKFSVKLEKRHRSYIHGFILSYKAESPTTLYVGEQKENNFGGKHKGIEFDENLLPYYKAEFRGRDYRDYDRILLSNTNMASSMAGIHQRIIKEILKKKDQDTNRKRGGISIVRSREEYIDFLLGFKESRAQRLYQKFQQDITEIIDHADEILEAYKQAYYLNDKSSLKKYSKVQRWLFENIANNGTYCYDKDKEKERLIPKQYNPNINLKEKCRNHGYDTKEEQAFSIWLYDYCMSRGYEKKILAQDKEDERVLLSYLGELKGKLKEKGFKEVKR